MNSRAFLSTILCLVVSGIVVGTTPAFAAKVGGVLSNVQIVDANNDPAQIPGFGKKIITIIYADMQGADMNDPLADALKAKFHGENLYLGVGVANLKDTWAPDGVVRMVVRRKIRKYKSTILTDKDYTIPNKWNLGNCDDTSVVLVIGADRKVKYIKKGPVRGAEIQKVVDLVAKELEALKQATAAP